MRIGIWFKLMSDSVCREHEVRREADAIQTSGELGFVLAVILFFLFEEYYRSMGEDENLTV